MMRQEKSLTALTKYGASELAEAVYKYKLTRFIKEQIYAFSQEAISGGWQLGKLHEDWDRLTGLKRLRILAPRDHLKTFYWTTAYPMRRLLYEPNVEGYIFSHTERQAIKILDGIKRAIRDNPAFDHLTKGEGVDFWTKKEMRCSNGATLYASSFGGAHRGAHPDFIIMDDVIGSEVVYSDEQNKKMAERFFADILPMAKPTTQIIMVGTLQREDDLYHSLDPEQWELLTYDAIVDEDKKLTLFPEKWSWDLLDARRREISHAYGDKFFLKEYRNMAVNMVGELIKKEYIKWYNPAELPDGRDYMGVDMSVGKDPDKGDYAAFVIFRFTEGGDFYIRHIFRARIDVSARIKKVAELYDSYKTLRRVNIENNTFQTDTVGLLKKSVPWGHKINGVTNTRNKVQRFTEDLAPLFENGKVYVPEGVEWVQLFVNEVTSLPRGKYDDMADAFLIGKEGLLAYERPRIRII